MKNKKEKGKRILFFCLKLLTVFSLVTAVSLTAVGLCFAIYVEKNIEKEIDEELFSSVGSGSSTKLYYYDFSDRENRVGEAVLLGDEELYGGYRCEYVSYESIPDHLKYAFVSIEDKRFFKHSGVDWKRSISAGLNYFLNFSDSYGGSTITQQLVKNVTENDDYSFQRKIQEIMWALDLETKMSKEEILEMYMNIINLSDGCYGVQSAANYYFSKDVSELTLSEAATIAAITNSPSYYNPIRNPENNKKRRNVILQEMYEQGYITESEYNEASTSEITIRQTESQGKKDINSWYVDMVIDDVINDLISEKGYSRQMANLLIYTGGLRIYTAMDINVQSELEKYYSNVSNFHYTTSAENPQSSMIVIDSKTGDIVGVAGAIGKKSGNRVQNFATQTLRPAGSVIKPLSVYAPAIDSRIINWATVYDDVPVNFGTEGTREAGEPVPWPKNSNGIYRGLTNINYAVEHSINTVVIRVLQDLGLDSSFDFLKNKLHIESLIESQMLPDGTVISDKDYAALGLGQFNYGATLREVSAAYSIFAAGGVYNHTRSYLSVTDIWGNEVLRKDYKGERVISEESAEIMTMMLENVIKNGTATSVSLDELVECAGKTGTTQNNYDRWFVGYTSHYICGCWYGYEYPKALLDSASNTSIKYWNDIMTSIHKALLDDGEVLRGFPESGNVIEAEYCADSGMVMSDACKNDPRGSRGEKGYFVKGSEPKKLCTCHVSVAYDLKNGGVADIDCPSENIKYVGMINVVRVFPIQIYVTDAEYVWRDIGKKTLPSTSKDLPFFANLLEEDEYSGISKVEAQYNRYCRTDFKYMNWIGRREE